MLIAVILFVVTPQSQAQRIPPKDFDSLLTKKADTIKPRIVPPKDSVTIIASDTIPINDTIPGDDSLQVQKIDTFSLKLSKDTLSAPLQYYAEDSVVVMIKSKKIYLYGKTKTEYQDITLTAPRVALDQETQLLTAYNSKDSTGAVLEDAVFKQSENEFTSDTIVYNFKTQKGLTKNTITQSGEMFVHGELVKKVDDNVTFVKNGLFTTCNLDEPHFAFRANKLKVINKKVAVSGPAHPEFEEVPIPVYIPFGFYPLSQGRKSGLLPPQFATNEQFGLGLEGLGYYQVFNQYWDTKFYGNIYSYGGWSANVNPTYRKRYRYQGSLNFGLQKTKRNFKGDPDFYSNNSYTLTWSHAADSRARPGTTFSANVNASSTTYNENVPNDPNLNIQNQLGSSISYSKTWADKPYNLTVTANHNQNNQTRLVNVSLPDVGFTVSTLYPFQSKEFSGSKKWYEQLGIAYNGNFRNQVSFYDTAFKVSDLIDTLQWGAQHNIPITLSLPPILGGAIVVSPGVSYSQVWVQQRLQREWDTAAKKVDSTVEKGFFVDQQAAFSLSFNTALFGTYQFKKSALRHVIRPTLSANYKPDLSRKYYKTRSGLDSLQINEAGYKILAPQLQGGMYSGYGNGRNGGLSFQLDNNLEMKVRNKKDTTGEEPTKKIRLIDGLGFSTAYNFLAPKFKLSPFNLYFRTNLFDKININASGLLNPYESDSLGQNIDEYVWEDGGFSLGRLSSGSISMSTTFQSKPRDEQKDQAKKEQMEQDLNDPVLAGDRQRLLEYMQQNPAEFVDFNIPWQVSLSYSLYFTQTIKPDYSGFTSQVRSSANFNGSFSLTPKWNFSVNGYYDFDTKKLQQFSMSINREMHCWQMSINVTPIGSYRFFNFTISPKSGILQDLRINRTRSFFAGY
ncbi:putative LPS assembly protein LptD [Terrimonas alba]|uniref:putative LPS assembly protein LptD n=1 Tax=Terrimonas alba TaxID=3349636 RepID=UPI0035F31FDB